MLIQIYWKNKKINQKNELKPHFKFSSKRRKIKRIIKINHDEKNGITKILIKDEMERKKNK